MASKNEAQPTSLKEIGEKLCGASNHQKEALLKLLKQAASQLLDIQQSAPIATTAAIKPCATALVLPAILKHRDKDVRLFAASCLTDVLRIYAPTPPYTDEQLREIFQLFVAVFHGLKEVSSPSFSRRVNILDGLAKVKTCIVMLDLDCADLIVEMFQTFFDTVSDEHPKNLKVAMRDVMCTIIDESEELPQDLLNILLENLLSGRKDTSRTPSKTAAQLLAQGTIQRSADSLKTPVQRFLMSNRLVGRPEVTADSLGSDYHDLIYELFCCAPQVLLTVLPRLQDELGVDQVDIRLKAVELLGKLFSLPGQRVAENYRQLFSEFLKRFHDKAPEVRQALVAWAKACLLASPTGPETVELITCLKDRLLDIDEKVRLKAVNTLCDLAVDKPKLVSVEILKAVADRLRDKKVYVRKEALPELLKVYRNFCIRILEGKSVSEDQYEWIPSRALKCGYDKECKEFKPAALDVVLDDGLFLPKLPVQDRARHWVSFFKMFDVNDRKMLDLILLLRQRLQQEFSNYLELRQQLKENDKPELWQKLQTTYQRLSAAYVDPAKAMELFEKLHQLKDNHVFKAFSLLLNPNTTLAEARATKDELLKKISEKQLPPDFVKNLATRISFTLFGKEHVKAVLAHMKENLNSDMVIPSMELLAEFAGHFPVLFEDSKDDLLSLLREEDEGVKEGATKILSKCGGLLLSTPLETLSPVEASLFRMCLEGKRSQAKHAVATIAKMPTAVTGLTALYQKLVPCLTQDAGVSLFPVLQSLGCIAQMKVSIFEAQEDHIVRFIVRDILRRHSVSQNSNGWNDPSPECLLKVYGLKLLTKSFLPDVPTREPRSKLKGLLNVLLKLLPLGEITDEIVSSDVDRAHVRLTAAKSVLRLARRWDFWIHPEVFQGTLQTAQDPYYEVRQLFVKKVAKYLRDRSLPHKYACTFALGSVDVEKENVAQSKKFLADFVENARREVRARQNIAGAVSEGSTLTRQPEYVLTYLIWVLAHHPDFPTKEEAETDGKSFFEPFQRQLQFFLRAVLQNDGGDVRQDLFKREELDNFPAVLAMLRTLKEAVDAVDEEMTENLYILCDMGILIATEEGLEKPHATSFPGEIQLPSAFYKPPVPVDGSVLATGKADFSHLPSCLKAPEEKVKPRQAGGKAKKAKREDDDSADGEEEPPLKKPRRKVGGEAEASPRSGQEAAGGNKEIGEVSAGAMEEDKEYGEELVGRKIRVWWPLDKKFYSGWIRAYAMKSGKHKIEYEDGEKEQLLLNGEKWEFADVRGKGSTRGKKVVGSEGEKKVERAGGTAGQNTSRRKDKSNNESMETGPEPSLREGYGSPDQAQNVSLGKRGGRGLPSVSRKEDSPFEGQNALRVPEGGIPEKVQSSEEQDVGPRGRRGRSRQLGDKDSRQEGKSKIFDEAAAGLATGLSPKSDKSPKVPGHTAPASEAATQSAAVQPDLPVQSNAATPSVVEVETKEENVVQVPAEQRTHGTVTEEENHKSRGGARKTNASGEADSEGKVIPPEVDAAKPSADNVASATEVEDEPADTIRSRRRRRR